MMNVLSMNCLLGYRDFEARSFRLVAGLTDRSEYCRWVISVGDRFTIMYSMRYLV